MLTNEERNKGRVRYEPETKMWIGVKLDGTLVEDKNRKVVENLLYIDSLENSGKRIQEGFKSMGAASTNAAEAFKQVKEKMLPLPPETPKIRQVLDEYPTYVFTIIASVSLVVAFGLGLLLGYYLK